MHVNAQRDDLLGALAVIVFLIGTATGNAYAMLGMSVVALILIAVFRRERIGSGAILVTLVAAVTALAIGIVMTMR